MIVLLLYWILLNCGANCKIETFFVHGINCALLLIDTFFNRIKFIPMHFVFVLIVDIIYFIYALV